MIKETQLYEHIPTVQYSGMDPAKDIKEVLRLIKDRLEMEARTEEIELSIREDQVKAGGMFNSSVQDCIVLYHPKHEKDYFNFCIRVRRQGRYCFMSTDVFGVSKMLGKEQNAAGALSGASGAQSGGDLFFAALKGIMSLGHNKQKLEEEKFYYSCLTDIIKRVLEGE